MFCWERELRFYKINSELENSVGEIIQKYVNKEDLETIILAKNAEDFPINETILPIIEEKYNSLLFSQGGRIPQHLNKRLKDKFYG